MRHCLTETLIHAADTLDRYERLCQELADYGHHQATQSSYDDDYAVAMWDAVPEGAQIGGELWSAIERGFRQGWRARRRPCEDPFAGEDAHVEDLLFESAERDQSWPE